MLAIGDTASGLAGAMIKGGIVRQNNIPAVKPFPIMTIMFFVCLIIGVILLNLPLAHDMNPIPVWVYVAGALGATIGDTVPVWIKGHAIDDNFMIPTPLRRVNDGCNDFGLIKTIFH